VSVPTATAIEVSNAQVLEAAALPAQLHFVTDTRALEAGDTFVALRGERFDGHDYVRDAVARGAKALVVDDPAVVPANVAALVVADTKAAYLAFGGAARRQSRVRVVAITGSAGKTTTKTFVTQILERLAPGPVVATPNNENNEIGVAKLLLGLPADAAFLVVEFGARHEGDIAPLARAALPELGVITNIGEAHLEIFGSRERLARTKWGIFETGAAAVLNASDAESIARARSLPAPLTWFGTGGGAPLGDSPANERAVYLMRAPEGDALLSIGREGEPSGLYGTELSVAGEHNRENAAAAAAAAIALGFAPPDVARALRRLALPAGRYERIALGPLELIYDAYNASMSGTLATLDSFSRERAPRRIAVLGSMAELGADSPAMHERVGEAAARAKVDRLLVGGDFATDIARGAHAAGLPMSAIVPFATNADAVAWLREHGRAGDLVLLKASRRYKLEEIVEGLRGAHAAG
jgi:UDP-N-acetylmuramoyl-tripeptide--D-alanyl-D-alanine ligase